MTNGNHAVGKVGLARGAAAIAALALLSAGPFGCSLILGIEELNERRDDVDASVPVDAALASDIFVDPEVGINQDVCSREQPCKTLYHALLRVREGQTIYLASGIYSAENGEDFNTVVPPGVTIEAMTPGGAVLLDNASISNALLLQGNATIRGLQIRGFQTGISALEGSVTLDSLEIQDTRLGLSLQGPLEVVAQSVSFTGGGQAFLMGSDAELRLVGGTISDMGPNCEGGVGIGYLQDSAHVIFEGVTAQNNFGSLELRQASSADLNDSTLINNGSDGCGRSTHIDLSESASVRLSNTTIERGPGVGILALDDNQISIMGGSFIGQGQGVALEVSASFLDVGGAKFSGYLTAARLGGRGTHSFHGAEFNGNGVGIEFNVDDGGFLDLGFSGLLGNNTFQQNNMTGLLVRGTAVVMINAAGNTWNPGEQGADANGQMPPGTAVVGPTAGSNYEISSSGPAIQF